MPRLIFNAKTLKLWQQDQGRDPSQQTAGEADRAAFETASKPAAANSAEFAQIAKMAASVDTLDGFLREMKARFPDATARAAAAGNPEGRSVPDRLAAGDCRIEAG